MTHLINIRQVREEDTKVAPHRAGIFTISWMPRLENLLQSMSKLATYRVRNIQNKVRKLEQLGVSYIWKT